MPKGKHIKTKHRDNTFDKKGEYLAKKNNFGRIYFENKNYWIVLLKI